MLEQARARPGSCFVCGGTDISTPLPYLNRIYEGPAASIFDRLQVSFCADCEMGFAHPSVPRTALADFYEHTYRSAHSYQLDDTSLLDKYKIRAVSQIQLAKTFWSPVGRAVRILDVGAGNGSFLWAAKALFPEGRLFAVEPDAHCHVHLRKLGATLIDPFAENARADGSLQGFDLIACSHVLEHYNGDDLDALLGRIRELLSPQGIVVVEVPYANIRKYPEPRDNDAPHLCFFSERSLSTLLAQHFEVVFCQGCGPDVLQSQLSRIRRSVAPAAKREAKMGLRAFLTAGLKSLNIPAIQRAIKVKRTPRLPDYHEYLKDDNYTYGTDRLVIRAVSKTKASGSSRESSGPR